MALDPKKRRRVLWLIALGAVAILAAGLRGYADRLYGVTAKLGGMPAPAGRHQTPHWEFFKSPWSTETCYIVHRVMSDVAEMAGYAREGDSWIPGKVTLKTEEFLKKKPDALEYEIALTGGPLGFPTALKVDVEGQCIWDPAPYQDATKLMLGDLDGSSSVLPTGMEDSRGFMGDLAELTTPALEKQNKLISGALETDFLNVALHRRAAILLGVMAFRERSGLYYDINELLCRMTAHLCMARVLTDEGQESTLDETIAFALRDVLTGRQVQAFENIDRMEKLEPGLVYWGNALRMRAIGDYRIAGEWKSATNLEKLEAFAAMCRGISSDYASQIYLPQMDVSIDVIRAMTNHDLSVGAGHISMRLSVPMEIEETSKGYELLTGKKLAQSQFDEFLNTLPQLCIAPGGADSKPQVRVISDGHWALQFQRHFVNAINANYVFLDQKIAIHRDAKMLADSTRGQFSKLIYFPFLAYHMRESQQQYKEAVDGIVELSRSQPELVGSGLWTLTSKRPDDVKYYLPVKHPHANEWRHYNPPPGTWHEPWQRQFYPSLKSRSDKEELRQQFAPTDGWLGFGALMKEEGKVITDETIERIYGKSVEWDAVHLKRICNFLRNNDQEELGKDYFLRAAKIDPNISRDYIYQYGDEMDPDEMEAMAERLRKEGTDTVMISHLCPRMVFFYFKKGDLAMAKDWADMGEQVFSASGLNAAAFYCELTGDPGGAAALFQMQTRRYGNELEEAVFLYRQAHKLGSREKLASGQKRILNRYFPKDLSAASLADFQGQPTAGVVILEDRRPDLRNKVFKGDIIVACNGLRTDRYEDFLAAKDMNLPADFTLIVWNGKEYRELTYVAGNRLMGGELGTVRVK